MNNKGGNDYERKFEQKKHGIQKDVLPNVYGSEVIKKEILYYSEVMKL